MHKPSSSMTNKIIDFYIWHTYQFQMISYAPMLKNTDARWNIPSVAHVCAYTSINNIVQIFTLQSFGAIQSFGFETNFFLVFIFNFFFPMREFMQTMKIYGIVFIIWLLILCQVIDRFESSVNIVYEFLFNQTSSNHFWRQKKKLFQLQKNVIQFEKMICKRMPNTVVTDLFCQMKYISRNALKINLWFNVSEPISDLCLHSVFNYRLNTVTYQRFPIDLWEGTCKPLNILLFFLVINIELNITDFLLKMVAVGLAEQHVRIYWTGHLGKF